MRFAYADPPYPGQARRHYKHHPDFDGEVDHGALIERLMDEFPDGWALSKRVRDERRPRASAAQHTAPQRIFG